MTSKLKALRSTVLAVALVALVGLIGTSTTSLAQPQSPTPATNEKVQQLMRLLDDPDVRAALEPAKPAAADPELPAAAQIAAWENRIRGHLAEIVNAFPRLPDEAANGVAVVRSQTKNHVFGMVWMLLGSLIALGFGAEWLFRRMVFVVPGNSIGADAHSTLRPVNLAVSLLYEMAPTVVFTIFSAGFFVIVSWPPLLRLMVLTYLVAFIAFRLVAAISRIVLDPPADAGVRENGASSRSAFLASQTDCFHRLSVGRMGNHQPSFTARLFRCREKPARLSGRCRPGAACDRNRVVSSRDA